MDARTESQIRYMDRQFKKKELAVDIERKIKIVEEPLKLISKRASPKNRKAPTPKAEQYNFLKEKLNIKVAKLAPGESMFFFTPPDTPLRAFGTAVKNACKDVFGAGVVGTSQKSRNGVFIYYK
jgi:hypothetical protein